MLKLFIGFAVGIALLLLISAFNDHRVCVKVSKTDTSINELLRSVSQKLTLEKNEGTDSKRITEVREFFDELQEIQIKFNNSTKNIEKKQWVNSWGFFGY